MATQQLRPIREEVALDEPKLATPPAAEPPRRLRALVMRVFTRRDGRAPVWVEAIVVLWLIWLYDQINNLAPLRRIAALHNAASVLALERSLNISPELGLDRWVASHATIGLALSYYYVSAHFFVTFGLLAYLWWRKSHSYRPLRTQLVIINLIGLVIFWLFPVAPPRMLASDGFRDVIAITGAVGNFHTGARQDRRPVRGDAFAAPGLGDLVHGRCLDDHEEQAGPGCRASLSVRHCLRRDRHGQSLPA
jgi:hypothetical protein